jgi:hypothetical protein
MPVAHPRIEPSQSVRLRFRCVFSQAAAQDAPFAGKHDPEYQKFAQDDMGVDYTPLSGEQLLAIVQQFSATSDEYLQFVKTSTKKYGVQQVE